MSSCITRTTAPATRSNVRTRRGSMPSRGKLSVRRIPGSPTVTSTPWRFHLVEEGFRERHHRVLRCAGRRPRPGVANRPASDATFTMWPCLRFIIPGRNALVPYITPRTFTSMMRSICSYVRFANVPPPGTPALFTRMSHGPNASFTTEGSEASCSGSVTSQRIGERGPSGALDPIGEVVQPFLAASGQARPSRRAAPARRPRPRRSRTTLRSPRPRPPSVACTLLYPWVRWTLSKPTPGDCRPSTIDGCLDPTPARSWRARSRPDAWPAWPRIPWTTSAGTLGCCWRGTRTSSSA